MPNLNDENLKPVSFSKGGLTHGGQVHLEGTYAYLPAELADLTSDEQVMELGDVYFEPGIRRGYLPASETYLAGEYQRRLANDLRTSDEARAARAEIDGVKIQSEDNRITSSPVGGARVTTGGPVGEIRELTEAEKTTVNNPGILRGGVDPHSGEVPVGYTLQNPRTLEDIAVAGSEEATRAGNPESPALAEGGGPAITTPVDDQRDAEGNLPQGYELSTATTDASLTESEKEAADARRSTSSAPSTPFPNAYEMNIEQTRAALADADDEKIDEFIAWERARTDRAPRVTLLRELGADADDEE